MNYFCNFTFFSRFLKATFIGQWIALILKLFINVTLQLWCLTVTTKPKVKPLVYLNMTLSTAQGICLGRQHPTLSMCQYHCIEKSMDAFKPIDFCFVFFCKHLEKRGLFFSCTCGFGYIVQQMLVSFLCGRKN